MRRRSPAFELSGLERAGNAVRRGPGSGARDAAGQTAGQARGHVTSCSNWSMYNKLVQYIMGVLAH